MSNPITPDIRGRCFTQEFLQSASNNLRGISAGNNFWAKLLLLIGGCGITSSLVGILFGLISSTLGIELVIGDPFPRLQSLVVFLLLLVWLIGATFWGLILSLLSTGLGLLAIAIMHYAGIISVPSNEIATFYTVILLAVAIAILCFFGTRFALALATLVLDKFRPIQVLCILILVTVAALLMAHTSLLELQFGSIEDTRFIEQQQRFLAAPNFVKVVTYSSTFLLIAALTTGAWFSNYRRQVPWQHPDLLRSLALTLATWQGTSFKDLDLSQVNFESAQLANCDLRARKLYRTNFKGALGLKRARVDSRYLDLELPKVQKLLTQGSSEKTDYSHLNLQGAFLQGSDLRRLQFIDTDLNGADLSDVDLRGAILTRAQVVGADFSNANLTGICIKDWSVNDQTLFTNVLCDYVYRELDKKGEPTDRYPADRNFEPQEFESLYQELGNVAELVFKEGVNWRAFSFSMQKLDIEDDGLGLELKGFERRGDRWVVRVTHNQHIPKQEVETRLLNMYDDMKGLLAAKEDQIHQLLGITADQATSIKELSQKPFGNSFFITGSTITNLTGSGQIVYTEAAGQVRNLVAQGDNPAQVSSTLQSLLTQLQTQSVATNAIDQAELIQQVMLAEAEQDPVFKQYLLQQGEEICQAMGNSQISQAVRGAIALLSP